MMDVIKFFVISFGYIIFAPAWGVFIAQKQKLEDATVFMLIFLTGLSIDTTVLMLGSIEWYRGVTKGYEFNLMETLAISLIVCRLMRAEKDGFSFFPAGVVLWMLYVFCSSLSLFSAVQVDYVLMSILKFSKAVLLLYAISNYVKDERRLHVVLVSLSVMILWQWQIVMKMKFIDGFYQVRGLFEHQNPLAIFTYMTSVPLLSAALSPATGLRLGLLYMAAFGGGSLIVLSSLSRAGLAFHGMATVATICWAFVDKITLRRIAVVLLMALGGVVLLSMTLDTIIARFNDEGNEASGETRDVMNLASKAMLDANPLGIGWNGFGKAINHPYPYGNVIDEWNRDRGQAVDKSYAKGVVESHYWLILGETGYLGMISYGLFIASLLLRGLWIMLRDRTRLSGAVSGGIVVACLTVYLHSTLERVLTQTKNLALWMILLGLISAMGTRRFNKPQKARKPSLKRA